jgi:hypothetical protein
MRIIRHSHTSARITEFVKEDRARVNIKVTPSLQYTDGIELRADRRYDRCYRLSAARRPPDDN